MPVYTYQCESCGVRFERHQKFSDSPLVWCPECGKSSLRKVYTPVGIVFKGSGFYATDHKSPSGNKWSGGQSEDKSGDKSTPNGSESKPTATSASTPTSESSSKKE